MKRKWKHKRKKTKSQRRSRDAYALSGAKDKLSDDLIADMQPLLSGGKKVSEETLIEYMLTSHELVEEPEFEELVFDPMECMNTLGEVLEEKGLDSVEPDSLPPEEFEQIQDENLEEVLNRLLTAERKREIIERLDAMRARLRRAGKRRKAAEVAMLQFWLYTVPDEMGWILASLTQALLNRNLQAAIAIQQAAEETRSTFGLDSSSSIEEVEQAIQQSGIGAKLTGMLRKIPGFRGLLEKSTDKIWDEGEDALYTGELNLGLFTEEEIEPLNDMIVEVFKPLEGKSEPNVNTETGLEFVTRSDAYLEELLTPERMAQMRKRIDDLIKHEDLHVKWTAFLLMLRKAFSDPEWNVRPLLHRALMGEHRRLASSGEDEA